MRSVESVKGVTEPFEVIFISLESAVYSGQAPVKVFSWQLMINHSDRQDEGNAFQEVGHVSSHHPHQTSHAACE